ncbi:MAG TPA: hypothetical protein VGP07_16760 [Polyangia bacterium]|jgi:hypothetical protein
MKRPLLATVALVLGGMSVGSARADELKATTGTPASPNLDAPAPAADAPKAHSAGAGLSLSPNTPQLTGGTNLTAKEAESLTPTTTAAGADEWKFDFHGYMRAPLRMSLGPASPTSQPANTGPGCAADPMCSGSIGSGLQLHGFPRVPGANYVTWEYTNTVPGPWAQLNFSYGNSRAMMTIIVDSYSQTSAGYRNLQAQQGIDQAFLTLNYPEAFGDRGGLVINAGSFQNRYGTAGKYDGGMYETYLFGRTHVAGITATANVDATPEIGITAEAGGGSKIEVVPFTNNQLFQIFKGQAGGNCNVPAGGGTPGCVTNQGFGYQNYLSDRDAEYLPYAGPVPQGSTFLAHGHLGASYRKMVTLGLHLIYTWTPDDNWSGVKPNASTGVITGGVAGNSQQVNVSDHVPRYFGPIQGSMLITGADLRLSLGAFGDGYVGYSYIDAKNINALADAVEVLHSFGGWQFKENFFGVGFNPQTGEYRGPQNETGKVQTIEAQYTLSFGALARYPAAFWGQGPDLAVTVFGMFSMVDSPAPYEAPAGSGGGGKACDASVAAMGASPNGGYGCWNINTKKLKFGADIAYTPLAILGFGFRYDNVQPDLDAAFSGSHQNFQVFTPRVVIKTAFVTHEAITFQYQRYILGSEAYAIYPNQWAPKADPNLFAVSATMWW